MVIPDHDDLWYPGLKLKSAFLQATRGSVAYIMLIFDVYERSGTVSNPAL